MRFSLITPTILRPSLLKLCQSIDEQTFRDYEHLVIVDGPQDHVLIGNWHPQRIELRCEKNHHNWGHTCRHNIWQFAQGEYVWCLDDDNYLPDNHVLADLNEALCMNPPWAIFPILRLGQRFYFDEPGLNRTDTGSFVIRRELGPWPDLNEYAADGIFVEQLAKAYPYQRLPGIRPLMVMPSIGGK